MPGEIALRVHLLVLVAADVPCVTQSLKSRNADTYTSTQQVPLGTATLLKISGKKAHLCSIHFGNFWLQSKNNNIAFHCFFFSWFEFIDPNTMKDAKKKMKCMPCNTRRRALPLATPSQRPRTSEGVDVYVNWPLLQLQYCNYWCQICMNLRNETVIKPEKCRDWHLINQTSPL